MWKLNINLAEDEILNNDLTAVISDVAKKYVTLIPEGPPLGYKNIEVKTDKDRGPMCVTNFLPEQYQILLNTEDRDYCRVVYQLSHEMCHIYCNPTVSNRFIESICELSSLCFLEYLGEKWQIDPPFPNWRDYAPNFMAYKIKNNK